MPHSCRLLMYTSSEVAKAVVTIHIDVVHVDTCKPVVIVAFTVIFYIVVLFVSAL